jgi:uncharacterized membrane protein
LQSARRVLAYLGLNAGLLIIPLKTELRKKVMRTNLWLRQGLPRKRINVGPAERKASLAGGAVLVLSGLKSLAGKRILPGLGLLAAGGLLIGRGKTGHCILYRALGVDTIHLGHSGLRIEKVITINCPPQRVYQYWRDLGNLPNFMRHLTSVQVTGDRTSHWKAAVPGGVSIEWNAEMMEDYPGQQISWHSLNGAPLPNKGTVEFLPAPGNRGTEVKIILDYYPPGAAAGRAAARLLRAITDRQIEEDLKRLKRIMEIDEPAITQNDNELLSGV